MQQTNIFETIAKAVQPDFNIYELAAIWITQPVIKTSEGPHARWVIGDKCKIVDSELQDYKYHNEVTHIITACRGDVYGNVLEFSVMDLKSRELSILKIK